MTWTGHSKPVPPAEFSQYQPVRVVGYSVAIDTPCVIKRKGDSRWRPFQTTDSWTFDKASGKGENGYTFERDGWLIHFKATDVTVVTETGTRPR